MPRLKTETAGRTQLLESGLTIEADTDIGPLLLERDAELLTPFILANGTWDESLARLLRRFLRPGMTFIDAGANVGYLSVLASQLVGEKGRVFSIEVDPTNVEILSENLRHLGNDNWQVLPVAAWDRDTTVSLMSNERGGAGIAAYESESGTASDVRAAPLSSLVEGPVDFIKVDCEGTDHLVVKGAADLIEANPRILLTVELSVDEAGHTGDTPEEILGQYDGYGLRPFMITEAGGLSARTFEAIRGSGGRADPTHYDIALSRRAPRLRVRPWAFIKEPRLARGSFLRAGGNLLEHVPEGVRPKIRHRDRVQPR